MGLLINKIGLFIYKILSLWQFRTAKDGTVVFHVDPMMVVFCYLTGIAAAFLLPMGVATGDPDLTAFALFCTILSLWSFFFKSTTSGPAMLAVRQWFGAPVMVELCRLFKVKSLVFIPGSKDLLVGSTQQPGKPNTLQTDMLMPPSIIATEKDTAPTGSRLTTKVRLKVNFVIRLEIENSPGTVVATFYDDFAAHHFSTREQRKKFWADPTQGTKDSVERVVLIYILGACDPVLQTLEAEDVRLRRASVNKMLVDGIPAKGDNPAIDGLQTVILKSFGVDVSSATIESAVGNYFDAIEAQSDAQLAADRRKQEADRDKEARMAETDANLTASLKELDNELKIAEKRILVLAPQIEVARLQAERLFQAVKVRLEGVGQHQLSTILADAFNQNAGPEHWVNALDKLQAFVKMPQTLVTVGPDIMQMLTGLAGGLQRMLSLQETALGKTTVSGKTAPTAGTEASPEAEAIPALAAPAVIPPETPPETPPGATKEDLPPGTH